MKVIRQSLSKIVTEAGESTLKESAKVRDHYDMIIVVSETDLIAKEFKKHEKCYLEYTKTIRQRASTITSTDDDDESFGYFDAVPSLIENDILEGQQCLSMETIMVE